jgi:hypothetical protein
MNAVDELTTWLSEQRAGWVARGVDILEYEGKTLFGWPELDRNMKGERSVFVGTEEACLLPAKNWREEDFIRLIVLGEISVEHSKILIENAVEQVAGR